MFFPYKLPFCTGDFPTIFDDTERKGRLLVVRRLTRMARPIACTACISAGLKGQPYMVRQRVQMTQNSQAGWSKATEDATQMGYDGFIQLLVYPKMQWIIVDHYPAQIASLNWVLVDRPTSFVEF